LGLIVLFSVLQFVEGVGDGDCTIPGDADILGLGVRLGIYFQLFANTVIAIVVPEESAQSVSVSNMLFTGIFIAVVYTTVKNDIPASSLLCMLDLLPLDMMLAFPIIAAAMADTVNVSFWTTSFVIFRALAATIFNIWFWYHGVGIVNESQCMEPRILFLRTSGPTAIFAHTRNIFTPCWPSFWCVFCLVGSHLPITAAARPAPIGTWVTKPKG
jgi:hypothetical protein